jgi:hydrogenase large subunit
MLIAYAKGRKDIKSLIDSSVTNINVMHSTLGRTLARAIEAKITVTQLQSWFKQLQSNINSGNLTIHNREKWDPSTWPADAVGYGFHEAPRGALGHWIHITNGKIANYQFVVPSTWNAGPRDARGQRGPYEEAIIGTPVANPKHPIEILRPIHSFDPCLACVAHVTDPRGREFANIKLI